MSEGSQYLSLLSPYILPIFHLQKLEEERKTQPVFDRLKVGYHESLRAIPAKSLSSSGEEIYHADVPQTGLSPLIDSALNVIKVPLSKLNLMSEADTNLKELHCDRYNG